MKKKRKSKKTFNRCNKKKVFRNIPIDVTYAVCCIAVDYTVACTSSQLLHGEAQCESFSTLKKNGEIYTRRGMLYIKCALKWTFKATNIGSFRLRHLLRFNIEFFFVRLFSFCFFCLGRATNWSRNLWKDFKKRHWQEARKEFCFFFW